MLVDCIYSISAKVFLSAQGWCGCRFSFQPITNNSWLHLFNHFLFFLSQLLGVAPVWLEWKPASATALCVYDNPWTGSNNLGIDLKY